jgi:hypothetical protein
MKKKLKTTPRFQAVICKDVDDIDHDITFRRRITLSKGQNNILIRLYFTEQGIKNLARMFLFVPPIFLAQTIKSLLKEWLEKWNKEREKEKKGRKKADDS